MTSKGMWASLLTVSMLMGWCIPIAVAGETRAAGWVTLFDGANLDGWRNARAPRAENKWLIEDGAMTNTEHGNDIATIQKFKNFDLRLEFKTVPGGNSGVYLRGRIEIQVLDSYGKEQPNKGDNGAIYDQFVPRVNASKPAGEWNQLEATMVGDEVTVILNGQLLHDKQKITMVTGGALAGKVADAGPLMLQGDHGKVWYRNIKIREIGGTTEKDCCSAEKCKKGKGNAKGACECKKAKTGDVKKCPKANSQCGGPKEKGCCASASGACSKTKGECPKAKGECPKANGGDAKSCPRAKELGYCSAEKGCCCAGKCKSQKATGTK